MSLPFTARAAILALTLLTAASVVSACAAPGGGEVAGAPPASATPTATSNPLAAGALQDPSLDSGWRDDAASPPVKVRIPAIGVDSGMESLGIAGDGSLEAPVDYDSAGWFAAGVTPGQVGPAIIAGHIDSPQAPAVFARLDQLAPGDEVLVDLADGRSLTFAVTGTQQSAKAQFPTADVYSAVPRPELRLITCAGTFDRATSHYLDNLIVYATLTG